MSIDVSNIETKITGDGEFNVDAATDQLVRWDVRAGSVDRYQLALQASQVALRLTAEQRLEVAQRIYNRRQELIDKIVSGELGGTPGSLEELGLNITPPMPQYAILGLMYPNRKVGFYPEDGGFFDYTKEQKNMAALAINEGLLPSDFIKVG